MSNRVTVVIPARYASTRLPGKVLMPIAGRPMVQHVWEQAMKCGAGEVVVATDDGRVAEAARRFGAAVLMTDPRHRTGTERVAEAASLLALGDDEVVVNVQADEPLLPPVLVSQVSEDLVAHPGAQIATLCERIDAPAGVFDPAAVKVVTDREGYALYFSRAAIPWHRGYFESGVVPRGASMQRHIGLYAYRAGYLRSCVAQEVPEIEAAEALEQLRALYHGARIHVVEARARPGPSVDTLRDLESVRARVGMESESSIRRGEEGRGGEEGGDLPAGGALRAPRERPGAPVRAVMPRGPGAASETKAVGFNEAAALLPRKRPLNDGTSERGAGG